MCPVPLPVRVVRRIAVTPPNFRATFSVFRPNFSVFRPNSQPIFSVFVLSYIPMPRRLSMLDLFSGTGSASRAALVRGWRVVRVDNTVGTAHDIRADLAAPPFVAPPPSAASVPPSAASVPTFDLIWASPPCTLLSTARNTTGRRDEGAGLILVRAALRIIRQLQPRWWVLENVHGATRTIGSILGPPVARYGSFYLWGCFPPFSAEVPRDKTRKGGRRRAERRAAIPWAISDGLARACEELAASIE